MNRETDFYLQCVDGTSIGRGSSPDVSASILPYKDDVNITCDMMLRIVWTDTTLFADKRELFDRMLADAMEWYVVLDYPQGVMSLRTIDHETVRIDVPCEDHKLLVVQETSSRAGRATIVLTLEHHENLELELGLVCYVPASRVLVRERPDSAMQYRMWLSRN